MEFLNNDNIIAPATAAGMGAIGITRLSGADSITIADALFYPYKSGSKRNKALTLKQTDSYKLRYGTIREESEGGDSKILDDVMVAVFRAPHSYTGENCVEIYSHASRYIMNKLILLFISKAEELFKAKKIANRLRMAAPGEFTQLAFINGKMDLAQAEAVADLIASETEAAHDVAMNQMRGGYSKELRDMREKLLHLASLMELELDFSEEDVEFADRNKLSVLLEAIEQKTSELVDSFAFGNAIKNGIPVAIVGAVNTGKSTLLNALVGEERAIVSDIQGTTRDTIEDTVNFNGHTFRFIDTAGIRSTTETIEILGIERTYLKLKESSVIILMLDCARPESFRESLQSIASRLSPDKQKLIVVANKSDVLQESVAADNAEVVDIETANKAQNIDGDVAEPAGHATHNLSAQNDCRVIGKTSVAGEANTTGQTKCSPFAVKNRKAECVKEIKNTAAQTARSSVVECTPESTCELKSPAGRVAAGAGNQLKTGMSVLDELSDICKQLHIKPMGIMCVSLATGRDDAVKSLKKLLVKYGSNFSKNIGSNILVTNARHYQALIAARDSLRKVSEGLRTHTPTDLVAQDIRDAISDLGGIIGEISSQDVLNNIFSHFCIGK